jgi:hypothetical protein
MTKTLNVGMIGYGFMAKAHSNAWRRVGNFFPEIEHRPALRRSRRAPPTRCRRSPTCGSTTASRPTGGV